MDENINDGIGGSFSSKWFGMLPDNDGASLRLCELTFPMDISSAPNPAHTYIFLLKPPVATIT